MDNESGYTGGAIGISAHSSDEKLACIFIMNGGEISNNRCGSLGGAIAASSGIIYMELNGGRISGNVTNAATSAAVYHGSKSGYMKLTGVCFEDNLTASAYLLPVRMPPMERQAELSQMPMGPSPLAITCRSTTAIPAAAS